MNRHPVRWGNLLSAVLLGLVLLGWAVWDRRSLDADDLGVAVAGTLIVAGVIGVIATVRPARRRTAPLTEGHDDAEEAHPQH